MSDLISRESEKLKVARVTWEDGEPKCKIKRTDFGLPWPIREDAP